MPKYIYTWQTFHIIHGRQYLNNRRAAATTRRACVCTSRARMRARVQYPLLICVNNKLMCVLKLSTRRTLHRLFCDSFSMPVLFVHNVCVSTSVQSTSVHDDKDTCQPNNKNNKFLQLYSITAWRGSSSRWYTKSACSCRWRNAIDFWLASFDI